MCRQRTRPSLGGEAGGRSLGFISASFRPQAKHPPTPQRRSTRSPRVEATTHERPGHAQILQVLRRQVRQDGLVYRAPSFTALRGVPGEPVETSYARAAPAPARDRATLPNASYKERAPSLARAHRFCGRHRLPAARNAPWRSFQDDVSADHASMAIEQQAMDLHHRLDPLVIGKF
jgi:hypothetical protein